MKEVMDFNESAAVGRKVSRMEREALEAAYTVGEIARLEDNPFSPPYLLYAGDESSTKQLEIVIEYLVEERFLFSYVHRGNHSQTMKVGRAGGITPKGMDRLRELRSPRRVWFEKNRLPAIVAGAAVFGGAASVASVVVNLLIGAS